jgi:integrase
VPPEDHSTPQLPATVDLAATLATYDTAAEQILAKTVPHNTRLAFESDWKLWETFCAIDGIPPTTVSSSLLVAFATWLTLSTPERPPQAPASISRRLAGVLDGWRTRKLVVPHGVTAGARRVVRAYSKDLAQRGVKAGRGSARAATIRDLRRVSDLLADNLRGTRDRSVLTLGFTLAARRSELASLRVADVEGHEQGLRVTIRDSKTGARTVAVRIGANPKTCPVRAWQAWLEAAGISDGPAFRPIDKWGNARPGPLKPEAIGEIVTAAGELIDLKWTGHSLRSGLATEARRVGHDAKTIAKQGGWKPNSAVLYGYMQIVDEWADNATEGLGL